MIEQLISVSIAITDSFRVQDFFDIFIITSLIYVVLIWFKNTASRFVFVGISLLGVVYFLARMFQLYLTSMVLQGFFAILLIALVVIFQEEIRRFFERLATWGPLHKRHDNSSDTYYLDIEIVVESVAELAATKTGALIVLQGNDPLERHLKGGYVLDGGLSQPLLASLFDTHSIGHDGAVVIDRGRVLKFGCHLPLSTDTAVSGKLGLRHTAGLGLSEKCDSLCIVVSEERGTISVAFEGKLEQVDVTRLTTILKQFYGENSPLRKASPFTHWVRQNTAEKLVAVLLSVALWLTFGYQKDWIQRDFMVPIEFRNIPEEWYVDDPKIFEAKVALSGSSQAFTLFDPSSLKISFNLNEVKPGSQDLILERSMVRVPSNLTVSKITPSKIKITAYHLVPVIIPVHAKTTGQLPDDLVLKNILITPGSFKVHLTGKAMKKKIKLYTEEIDLSGITQTATLEPRLIIPPDVHFKEDIPSKVQVTLLVEKKDTKPPH